MQVYSEEELIAEQSMGIERELPINELCILYSGRTKRLCSTGLNTLEFMVSGKID